MECTAPIYVKGRGTLPCGKCLSCLLNRTNHWSFRLKKEYENNYATFFVTLTYEDSQCPTSKSGIKVLEKRDLQLWFKRLRKALKEVRVRYFACGEYGVRTLRPHYHAILFFPTDPGDLKRVSDIICSTWNKGFTVTKLIKDGHFNYVAKYCASYTQLPKFYRRKKRRPFSLCSRRPAIGACFLTDSMATYYRQHPQNTIRENGVLVSMPKYYRDKLYDDEMKEQIRERSAVFREQMITDLANREMSLLSNPQSAIGSLESQRREEQDRRIKKVLFKDVDTKI